MYYIIHIATAFQSLLVHPRQLKELIWKKTQNDLRRKDPNHPILAATLDQYLNKEAQEISIITSALKSKMALTPEFGHVIAIGKALIDSQKDNRPKLKVEVAKSAQDEKKLLESFWEKLGRFIAERGMPAFVTWNGLGFTFPFLIERSTALGLEPSFVLPRARFQPWKHLDLLAELANYDRHRYIDLQNRLALWGVKLDGDENETSFRDPETVIERWRKGDPKPLKENLILTLQAIHIIFRKIAPYLLEKEQQAH